MKSSESNHNKRIILTTKNWNIYDSNVNHKYTIATFEFYGSRDRPSVGLSTIYAHERIDILTTHTQAGRGGDVIKNNLLKNVIIYLY